MRIVSSTFAAVLAIAFLAGPAGSHGSTFRSLPRTARSQARAVTQIARPAYRSRSTASCASAAHGSYAFDTTTTFTTNFSTAEAFGQNTVAAGAESGTFEGVGNVVCDDQSVIAGGTDNSIDSGSANTPSGALASFIGGGGFITISSGYAFDGAGQANTIANYFAGVGAGYGNNVGGRGSFIAAGGSLLEQSLGNQISSQDAFIGAGDANIVEGDEAFIGSGSNNLIGSGASFASILGGNRNTVTGEYASVLGGFGSAARGTYSIVAGGDADTAGGTLSFAAGYHADAFHNGSFVWSDYVSGSSAIKDSAANQFVVRASGGTYVYSNEGATAGVKLSAGSGAWANLSDRSAKTDIRAADDATILAKVRALPIATWRYKTERGVRHTGPMAQDFYAAFGDGDDDRHITSVDEDGVALAAIKALSKQVVDLRGANERLQARLAAVEAFERRQTTAHPRLDARGVAPEQ